MRSAQQLQSSSSSQRQQIASIPPAYSSQQLPPAPIVSPSLTPFQHPITTNSLSTSISITNSSSLSSSSSSSLNPSNSPSLSSISSGSSTSSTTKDLGFTQTSELLKSLQGSSTSKFSISQLQKALVQGLMNDMKLCMIIGELKTDIKRLENILLSSRATLNAQAVSSALPSAASNPREFVVQDLNRFRNLCKIWISQTIGTPLINGQRTRFRSAHGDVWCPALNWIFLMMGCQENSDLTTLKTQLPQLRTIYHSELEEVDYKAVIGGCCSFRFGLSVKNIRKAGAPHLGNQDPDSSKVKAHINWLIQNLQEVNVRAEKQQLRAERASSALARAPSVDQPGEDTLEFDNWQRIDGEGSSEASDIHDDSSEPEELTSDSPEPPEALSQIQIRPTAAPLPKSHRYNREYENSCRSTSSGAKATQPPETSRRSPVIKKMNLRKQPTPESSSGPRAKRARTKQ